MLAQELAKNAISNCASTRAVLPWKGENNAGLQRDMSGRKHNIRIRGMQRVHFPRRRYEHPRKKPALLKSKPAWLPLAPILSPRVTDRASRIQMVLYFIRHDPLDAFMSIVTRNDSENRHLMRLFERQCLQPWKINSLGAGGFNRVRHGCENRNEIDNEDKHSREWIGEKSNGRDLSKLRPIRTNAPFLVEEGDSFTGCLS